MTIFSSTMPKVQASFFQFIYLSATFPFEAKVGLIAFALSPRQ